MHPWVLPRAGSVGVPLLGNFCPGGDAAAGGGHRCHSVPPVLGGDGTGGHSPGALRGLALQGAGRGWGSPSWQPPWPGGVPSSTPPAAAR